ncbi:hypothetical protein V1512DRAFT_247082 [Lipomyces arxii]|uniref:uncharacterized protein n=1 Tax=Lipomyces arxii TaxID=56418 RepID=UPI0034CF2FF0
MFEYPLLYIFPVVGVYAVCSDEANGLITKIVVSIILLIFFSSMDMYLFFRRKAGIPDTFRYDSSESENELSGDFEDDAEEEEQEKEKEVCGEKTNDG